MDADLSPGRGPIAYDNTRRSTQRPFLAAFNILQLLMPCCYTSAISFRKFEELSLSPFLISSLDFLYNRKNQIFAYTTQCLITFGLKVGWFNYTILWKFNPFVLICFKAYFVTLY